MSRPTNGRAKLANRFGRRLRKVREHYEMTQAQLAQLAECDESQVSNFEHGKVLPSFETLRNLCMALQVDSNYLLLRRGR